MSALFFSLQGCAPREQVTIHLLTSFSTGSSNQFAFEVRNAVAQSLNYLQAQGTTSYDYQLRTWDDGGDVERGKEHLRSIASSEHRIIIGPTHSTLAPLIPWSEEEGLDLLFISPSLKANSLTNRHDNFIRLNIDIADSVHQMIKYLEAENQSTVLLIGTSGNPGYTNDFLSTFRAMADSSSLSLVDILQVDKALDRNHINSASQSSATVIIANGFNFARIAQDLHRNSYEGILLTSSWGFTTEALIAAQAIDPMVVFQAPENHGLHRGTQEVLSSLKAAQLAETWYPSLPSIEIIMALVATIEKHGPNQKTVAEHFGEILNGFYGDSIGLNQYGDSERTAGMYEMRNGNLQLYHGY